MKFAREFQEILKKEDFPPSWVQLAISYGQLKKCIKKVQRELADLGLDACTLKELLKPVEASQGSCLPPGGAEPRFQYAFLEGGEAPRPHLFIVVDAGSGNAIDAGLTEATKDYLRLLIRQRASPESERGRDSINGTQSIAEAASTAPDETHCDGSIEGASTALWDSVLQGRTTDAGVNPSEQELVPQRIEVPLTFDSEFFRLLTRQITGLDRLQEAEQEQLNLSIPSLGHMVSHATTPRRFSSSKSDLSRWRQVFELYTEANIFFSTTELDHGARTAATAAKQLQWFTDEVNKRKLARQFKNNESPTAFEMFVGLNVHLVRNLRFQEVNRTAMFKILKKFDKRTALGVKKRLSAHMAEGPFLGRSVAKAVCFQLAQEVLTTVPRLDDYLCPVCFSIALKPVRLECGHIFCIRCMIVMQRAQERYCPLCRGDVVMKADTTNIDSSLLNFLKEYFPAESKAKQRSNARVAELEHGSSGCALM